MRPETAQDQQNEALVANPKLGTREELAALLNEKSATSSPALSSTAFDPIEQPMKNHPILTREKAEEMARAFGF